MIIIKQGDSKKTYMEFFFHCKNCSCEWGAKRNEVKINPPILPFATYMNCPNCNKKTYDREW